MTKDVARAPRRAVRPLPAWLALLVSLCAHVAVLSGLWALGLRGGSLFAGGGEGGLLGAGGETLEITVAGWDGARAAEPGLAPEAGNQSETEAESESETESESEIEAETETESESEIEAETETGRGRGRRTLVAERGATAVEAEGTAAAGAPSEGAEAPGPAGGETASAPVAPRPGESDADRSGRAAGDQVAAVILGSVGLGGPSSSRAILEGSLGCDDPIEGVWTAHRYSPARRDWARMSLRIEREGDELRGTITSRVWSGLPSDRRPLPCAPGRFDVTVRMPARGRIDGERFSFGASSYDIVRSNCPSPEFFYYPDHFSGRVDSAREELDAVNNDGHVEFDAPYTFRRNQCLE